MKTILAIFILLCSSVATAGVEIHIGRGGHICSSEGMKDHPSLARGTTPMVARHNAQKACGEIEGSEFHCKVQKCVQDPNRGNLNLNIGFSIYRAGDSISIRLNQGQSTVACRAKAFSKSYLAEAPTRLEAEVLARTTCIKDGYHGMHCDIEECDGVGPSAGVSINGDKEEIKGDIKDVIKDIKGLFE